MKHYAGNCSSTKPVCSGSVHCRSAVSMPFQCMVYTTVQLIHESSSTASEGSDLRGLPHLHSCVS